jgi:transposase-like protein
MKTAKRRRFDPQQKITAVLSVWTERRTSSQICKEMSISPTLLSKWQNLAMEAMLLSLSPKKADREATLPSRLTKLIERNLPDPTAKLQKRLKVIQESIAS